MTSERSEQQRRIRLARGALIDALRAIEDGEKSACGFALIAATHLSHVPGQAEFGLAVFERVQAEQKAGET